MHSNTPSSTSTKRLELRSPDPTVNLYVVYSLLINASLDGIEKGLLPPEPLNINLYTAGEEIKSKLSSLPDSYESATKIAKESEYIKETIPLSFLR